MEYWLVNLDNDNSAFLKIATGSRAKKMIADEVFFYDTVGPKKFLPRYYGGIVTEEYSALLIEDLSNFYWAPPWDHSRVIQATEALEEVRLIRNSQISRGLSEFKNIFMGWEKIKKNPEFILASGIRDINWLDKKLDTLIEYSASAFHDSKDLIHFDVRSDNLCFSKNQAILIDWAWYCRGPFDLQMATWALTLSTEEGGPMPQDFLPNMSPQYVALIAGYFAQFVGVPCPDGSHVRDLQFKQLVAALEWFDKIC